jgi:hypothetical protein
LWQNDEGARGAMPATNRIVSAQIQAKRVSSAIHLYALSLAGDLIKEHVYTLRAAFYRTL